MLRPAVATAQNNDTGAILSAAQQAALSPGDGTLGEEPGLAACLFARDLQLQHFALASMDDRKLVISNCAVGGRTIEQLSKGASPELFNRLRVMSAAGKAAVQAANLTYGIPEVLWLQGEYNYVPDFGGSNSKSSYKAKLAQLISDIKSELVPDQSKPPALIMYQTGGQYTSDAADLSIGDAQWELSQEMAGVFITVERRRHSAGGTSVIATLCKRHSITSMRPVPEIMLRIT